MSTCSTATSTRCTHRVKESRRRRRPPNSDAAVRGHLEMRLQDLERDWEAYKIGRSGVPRHRRSRSASSLAYSAVTVAAPDDGFHISLLRRSPRRLVSSLQLTGSADDVVPAAGPCDKEDASSVCSVEGVANYCSSCSCSCPSQCAVLCYGGYSTSSSSCTGTIVPPFSSDINGGRARRMDEGKWAASRALWISGAIAFVFVMGFVAMIILVLRVDEGYVEYQVPT